MNSQTPDRPDHPTSTELAYEDWYGINGAAEICGVSRDTIKRRLRDGHMPGARRGYGTGPGGPWLIPASDLRAAGLLKDGTQNTERVFTDDQASEIATLRRRLAAAEATIAA